MAFAVLASACVPRVRPLLGTAAPARLPAASVGRAHRRIVFAWQYDDPNMTARGDGVARVSPPDSVRLDLFLAGGFGSAVAYLLGDTIIAPGGNLGRRLLPPPPLAWAALGRLAVPPQSDTTARVDGGVLRADIGRDRRWRVSFAGDSLVSLEKIDGDRLIESVVRGERGTVRYAHHGAHRSLTLAIVRNDSVSAFDPTIWHP